MRSLKGLCSSLFIGTSLLLFGAAPVLAADTITADETCCTFVDGPFSQDLGEIPVLDNPADSEAPHNVTATANGPDGQPLFRSDTIPAGETSRVKGAQYLPAGTYPFVCTLHPPSMTGELVVEGGKGAIVARPKIKVSLPAQRLKKVRRTGRIKVKVRAITDSSGVALRARKGRKAIGSASRISLKAGASRKLMVKLTRAGKRRLAKGRKAKVSVKGSVPFGRSDSAKRKLR